MYTRLQGSPVFAITAVLVLALLLLGCPSPDEEAPGLTEWQLEHGIGPITEPVELEETIDEELAVIGEDAYQTKCESCHRMEARFVGPPLGNILQARTPEFVMNFMLNPSGMIREHPVGQQLLREYLVEMPYQNVSEQEARAILEYLRAEQE